MTNAWTDFNDVKQTSNLIPKGTIVKVRMTMPLLIHAQYAGPGRTAPGHKEDRLLASLPCPSNRS